MRVKRGVTSHAKHKKVYVANKGYKMTKRRLIRVAKQAYLHAGEYAFAGRKNRKRDFRRLWITRISQAVRLRGLTYNGFIHSLKEKEINLDRKTLSYLVTDQPESFDKLIEDIKTVN